MKISIVVPIYNVPKPLLMACLDSVIKQTLRQNDFEIILVDDCSTEQETLTAIDSFAAPNLKVIHHSKNQGLNESRHSGVKAATGDYVIFVDGDDILTRDAIESLRMAAFNSNADIVTAAIFRWIHENKTYTDQPFFSKPFPKDYLERLRAWLEVKHSFTMCARLFRREILTSDIFCLPRDVLHEDITTFVRVLFKANVVSHVDRPIYYYTVNSNSITSNFTEEHVNGVFAAFDDWQKIAKHHHLYDALFSSMAEGAEVLSNRCVEECILSENLGFDDKANMLRIIAEKYSALPIARPQASRNGMKFLSWFEQNISSRKAGLQKAAEDTLIEKKSTRLNPKVLLDRGLAPSGMALRLKGKIVFICQVDYQIRNAARLCRELDNRGCACVILDNSGFASDGLRQLPTSENKIFAYAEHIKIESAPYDSDWLSCAKLILTFNDFNNDFREALEYRHRLGLPSICVVEGINDFLRVDFEGYRYLPYRRCDYVFLAGEHDRRYFQDRKAFVVGLPIIEELHRKPVNFPTNPLVVLNVNFTYGALETKRSEFVEKAKRAFSEVGVDWVITQHPMDTAELRDLPVSKRTQYELIDEGSVFVSRFATGILEALASGKPAIYFNPHGEKVEKFQNALGAFSVATNESELAQALRAALGDIEAGVDFRKRAALFLKHHTNYPAEGSPVTTRFADAVATVLGENQDRSQTLWELLSMRPSTAAAGSKQNEDPQAELGAPEPVEVRDRAFTAGKVRQKFSHLGQAYRRYWRHNPAVFVAAVTCMLFATPAMWEMGWSVRTLLWAVAALLALAGGIGILLRKALRRKLAKLEERLTAHMRDVAARFASLETRLTHQHAAQSKITSEKFARVEAELEFIKSQAAALNLFSIRPHVSGELVDAAHDGHAATETAET